MDSVKSTPPSPFMELPNEMKISIVTFCTTCTGARLSATRRELRDLLYEEVRKVQSSLICRVAEGIEKSGVLNDEIRRGVIELRDEVVREIQAAPTLKEIARISLLFGQKMARLPLKVPDVVWLDPFVSIVDGDVKRGHHFIPPDLEKRVCQAMIDINGSYFSDRTRLEEALTLMREGELDQTKESTKVEADGKSCVLAGLGKAATQLRVMDRPLFFDILARIGRKEVRELFLLFCIKKSSECYVSKGEIFNFLTHETFFFSLSPETQFQVIEELHRFDPMTILTQVLHFSDPAIKKKALELEINARTALFLIDPERQRLMLDIWNSIPIAERKGPVCAFMGRLEEICRRYQSEFPFSKAFWDRELNRIYPFLVYFGTEALLKILVKDDRWRVEPPSKMLEEMWELLSQFPNLSPGLAAYLLFMHAVCCVQYETSCEEVTTLMNIILEKINRMEREKDKIHFIESFFSFGISSLEMLTRAKGGDFVNYESFIDQIKGAMRRIVGYQRSLAGYDFGSMGKTLRDMGRESFKDPGHGNYPRFYIWAGLLQEVFPKGAEKDEKIMLVCQLYNDYGLKKDSLAQKMVCELVDQIEDQEKKREALLLV